MTDLPWLLFVGASLVVIMTPGQDMLLVLSRGLSTGARAGLATAAGLGVGTLVHTVVAAFGVGALIVASSLVFTVLKVMSAAYLAWLGLSAIRGARANAQAIVARVGGEAVAGGAVGEIQSTRTSTTTFADLRRSFLQGLIANVTNPKVAIFFLAFVPQFVAADTTAPVVDTLRLGVLFMGLAVGVKGGVALLAGAISTWISRMPGVLTWLNRVSGSVLIALGVGLLFETRP
ncbi:MAG: LysE family translocator [Pseudomonadota bacterium]